MRRYRTVLGLLSERAGPAGACIPALATPYNDSSVTGGSEAWNQWGQEWETVATDYTKVSLTPGEDETQLNFAWYSQNNALPPPPWSTSAPTPATSPPSPAPRRRWTPA